MRVEHISKGEKMASTNGKGQMRKVFKRAAAICMAITGVAVTGTEVLAVPTPTFYDYQTDVPSDPNFGPAPFLDNNAASAAAAAAALAPFANGSGAPLDPNRPLAVKVRQPLTDPAARAIFDQYQIRYVFADFEDGNRQANTYALATQVQNSGRSASAFVGNFNFYPNSTNDATRPPSAVVGTAAQSFAGRPQSTDYVNQGGPKLAQPSLYPGSPDYRTPFNSQNGLGGSSSAPNIRSALFTLPIQRATTTENGLRGFGNDYLQAGPNNNGTKNPALFGSLRRSPTSAAQNIPYVTRFNNYGNPVLDTDGSAGILTAGHEYAYVQNAANPTQGQLLARGDFQAQMLHYRMRGAQSVVTFGGGVLGYTDQQQRDDADIGWEQRSVTANNIFNRGNYAFANLSQQINARIAGSGAAFQQNDISRHGAAWSGVFDAANPPAGQGSRRLTVLLSNLREQSVEIDLPAIGGFITTTDKFVVGAGRHRLLTFTLVNGKWQFNTNTDIFFSDLNRNGVGIPEPTTLGLLGVGAMGLLARRRRKTA